MRKRQERAVPLVCLLARLGWQRDPAGWTVPCRDERGRRAAVRVGVYPTGITLTPLVAGPLTFEPLHAGKLRAATRDALLVVDGLTAPEQLAPDERHDAVLRRAA